MIDRYQVTGPEGVFEPGSNDEVLANKLGLVSPGDMAEVELLLLEQLYEAVLVDDFPRRRLSFKDIRHWHRRWLGNVYPWAGEVRSVNMSKGGFPFAAANLLLGLLTEFEERVLSQSTPCMGMSREMLVSAIARTHVEFIVIHPFREGNGRLSRLLADVMAVQAGFSSLDYSVWDAAKEDYFAAIQQGGPNDYTGMEALVDRALYG